MHDALTSQLVLPRCSETLLRALVVAQDDSTRARLARRLASGGYRVAQATAGPEALEQLQTGAFAVVVTELDPSQAGDRELLLQANATSDNTVIVLLDREARGAEEEMLRAGAFDCLVGPPDVTHRVEAALDRAINKAELLRENQRLLYSLKRNVDQLMTLNRNLQEQAMRDGMTGLYNHRYFREALDIEIKRCRRYSRVFSLLIMDIDFFKQFNDTHGHLAGDELLAEFSAQVSNTSRAATLIARYGGEEFVVLAPETDLKGARGYAERIRKLVQDYPFKGRETQPGGRVTMSIGVAMYPDNGKDATSIVAYADRALYRAKDAGRNTFCW